ncbi:MAG: hypothetical protein H6869_09150 [Rhodospirillales bacterium]|nr:hypothetical protein [Rhodospirillales bacterium]
MIVIGICAIMMIVSLSALLLPLMLGSGKDKMLGWALLCLMTIATMGLYLSRGAPYIPSAPALFERSGPNFDKRQAVNEELALLDRLAQKPDDADLMLALGSARMKNGRLPQAVTILETARQQKPTRKDISEKLGAAYYAAALVAFLVEDDTAQAGLYFDQALQTAPADAPYKDRLSEDYKKFQDEKD